MSGGVRNLRAMFEQSNTSPPDRGRSPGDSATPSAGRTGSGASPRPLSTIRTNFVTVEKPGQIGLALRKDTSGEPSIAKRRTSFSIDEKEHPKETAERKESIAAEFAARKNSIMVSETVPEMALVTPSMEEEKTLDGAGSSAPAKESPKVEPMKTEEKKPVAAVKTTNSHTNGTAKASSTKSADKSATKPASRPTPITTTAKTMVPAKTSPKKSPLPKTPTTPSSRHPSAKVPEKEVEKKVEHKVEKKVESKPVKEEKKLEKEETMAPKQEKKVEKDPVKSSHPHQAKPASKPPTTAAHGAPAKVRIPASPPQSGFVKPKARSPTRPVKLPASLTAHTASSGSKTAVGGAPPSRQSLSRASGNAQPTNSLQAHHATSRSPSRVSNASTAKTTIVRKPSTLKNTSNRPSLGPPPKELKKQPSRQSLPAPADESFLARMMRPTTASASKTAEKPPTTPPKRSQSVKRPTTRDGSSRPIPSLGSPPTKTHKEHPVKASKEIKPVEKLASPKKVEEAKPIVKAASPKNGEEKVEEKVEQLKAEVLPPTEPVLQESPEKEVEIVKPAPEVVEAAPVEPEIEQVVEMKHVEELIPETVVEEPAAEELAVKEDEAIHADDVKVDIPVAAKASEPEKESPVEIEVDEKEATPEAEPVKNDLVESELTKEEQVKEEFTPIEQSPIVHQEVTKPELIEDPEDVKAREEIARLNAEFMKASLDEEAK